MNNNLKFVIFFGILAASMALPIDETEHESREGRQFFNGANAAAQAASFGTGFGGGFSGANAAAQASSFGGGFGGGFSGANAAASANSFGGGFVG